MTKVTFSQSDVAAITNRMSTSTSVPGEAHYAPTNTPLSHAPSSPVAAKVMREFGVSTEKITAAFKVARNTVRQR